MLKVSLPDGIMWKQGIRMIVLSGLDIITVLLNLTELFVFMTMLALAMGESFQGYS